MKDNIYWEVIHGISKKHVVNILSKIFIFVELHIMLKCIHLSNCIEFYSGTAGRAVVWMVFTCIPFGLCIARIECRCKPTPWPNHTVNLLPVPEI